MIGQDEAELRRLRAMRATPARRIAVLLNGWPLRPASLSVGMHLDMVHDVVDREYLPGIAFRHLALRLVAQHAGERQL